jgi:hypothetical protein
MRNVGFGCRDIGKPCLFFETYISENAAASQILRGEKADALIVESGVYDVRDLEGKACWVECDGMRIDFAGYCKI